MSTKSRMILHILSKILSEAGDTKVRTTYVDKNSQLSAGTQKFIQQVAKKIPYATRLLQPGIDMWGRERETGGIMERAFENLVSPGYYEKKEMTELDKEIERLFEETGDDRALPSTLKNIFKRTASG